MMCKKKSRGKIAVPWNREENDEARFYDLFGDTEKDAFNDFNEVEICCRGPNTPTAIT